MSVMRGLLAVVVLLVAQPAFAQTYLKREPLLLRAYASVLVQTSACGPAHVMRVTGSTGARPRKRVCVPIGVERASLGFVQ